MKPAKQAPGGIRRNKSRERQRARVEVWCRLVAAAEPARESNQTHVTPLHAGFGASGDDPDAFESPYRSEITRIDPAPDTIDGAQVLYSSPLDARHRPTGACRHTLAGRLPPPFAALAICQYAGDTAYYLFYCDEHWKTVTDAWHATLADAMHQAQSEYKGVSSTWHRHDT